MTKQRIDHVERFTIIRFQELTAVYIASVVSTPGPGRAVMRVIDIDGTTHRLPADTQVEILEMPGDVMKAYLLTNYKCARCWATLTGARFTDSIDYVCPDCGQATQQDGKQLYTEIREVTS